MNTPMLPQALYAVYGASGCGRGVMPLARQQLVQAGVPASRLVFVDDGLGPATVNGQRLLSYAQFLAEPAASRHCVLAIHRSSVRKGLVRAGVSKTDWATLPVFKRYNLTEAKK